VESNHSTAGSPVRGLRLDDIDNVERDGLPDGIFEVPIRELEPGARDRWRGRTRRARPGRLDMDATAAELARVRLEPQRYKV
jgi:hypothetical protein